MQELEDKLLQFETQAFPMGMRSKSIGGKNITLFQSEVLGVIHTIIETNGRLGSRMRSLLITNIASLEKELDSFDSGAKAYFEELHTIALQARDQLRDLR